MIYREWKYEDVAEIAVLENQCFSDPWNYQMLADSFMSSNFKTKLCEVDGKVVGYIGAVLSYDEADIALVAVDKNYRGKGIGKELIKSLEKVLIENNIERVFLEVRVSNSSAIALYLKSGFTGRSVRLKYYGDGEDAIVMEKTFTKIH